METGRLELEFLWVEQNSSADKKSQENLLGYGHHRFPAGDTRSYLSQRTTTHQHASNTLA